MTKRTFRGPILVAALVVTVVLFAAACGTSSQTTMSASISPDDSGAAALVASTESGTSGSIVFSGLINYPMTFTALDMDYMDWVTISADDPALGSTDFEGVRLRDIFSYVGVQANAKTVVITAVDGSASEVAVADVSSDALLAVADDNTLSTVMPGMASAAWVKDIVKMTFK